ATLGADAFSPQLGPIALQRKGTAQMAVRRARHRAPGIDRPFRDDPVADGEAENAGAAAASAQWPRDLARHRRCARKHSLDERARSAWRFPARPAAEL